MGSLFGLQNLALETTPQWIAYFLVPSAILTAGTIDDLRSKKIHNKLILSLLPVAIFSQLYVGYYTGSSFSALGYGALAFGVALGISVPMVLSGMLGGGDMKLYAVFAIATNIAATVYVGFYSLFWGALFGVMRAILMGQGLVLFYNMVGLVKREKPAEAHLTKIPYSVALLFGWMTYMSLRQMGGR
jgi:Flp pilus assembly protein protease CpaA